MKSDVKSQMQFIRFGFTSFFIRIEEHSKFRASHNPT